MLNLDAIPLKSVTPVCAGKAEYLPPGATLAVCKNPFKTYKTMLTVEPSSTVAELLVAHGYSSIFKHPFICTIERLDGTLIELDKLRMTTYLVRPGDIIGIRAVMTKGGGKNPLGMVLQIAMMVAAYYVAPYLAAGFESMGMATLTAAGDFATFGGMVGSFMVNNAAMLATGALGMVSLMASSFLVGPQSANTAGTASSETTNTYYSITGSSNKVNKFGCIPYVLGGTVRVYPSHACEPYTEVINNIEYIRQIFVLYGPVKISDIRLGDTPISDYTNYDIEVLEGWPTDPKPSLYSTGKDYHQVNLNLTLKKSTGRVVRHIETDCDEIMFDVLFPSGLYNINKSNGSKSASTAEFVFEYKLSSSNTWIPWGQLNVIGADKGAWAPGTAYKAGDTVLSPDGVVSTVYISHISANYPTTVDRGIYTAGVSYAINDKVSYGGNPYRCTIAHVAQAIAVDAAGVSTGGFDATKWVKIAASLSELFTSDSAYYTQQSTTISGKLDPGAKQTFRMCVANGSYDIAWTRITEDDTTGYKIDKTTIATLRSIAYRDPINWNSDLPPLASVSVRMQGTDQLSGIISDLNFLASPYLPVYDSVNETWSYQLSDNPAWAYLSPLRGPGIQEPIPDDEIDIDTFADWAAWNTSMGFKINGLIDTQRTLQSILKDIAFCGRATPGMRDNLYSVVVDKPDSRYAQVITPRNSWNFQGKKQFPDNPHALRVTFNNQDKEFQQDERYVYAPGYNESTATLFETLDLTFITDADNAYQQGIFQCAQVKHRPEEFTVYMDAEHLRCTRGDRIKVQHDVILIGQGAARIKVVVTALNPDNGVTYVTDMVLDNKFIMEAGKNYAVGVRYNNGDLVTYGVVNIPGESNVLKFSAPPPVALSPKEDNIVWFGEAGKESEDCRIMCITPGADLTAQLTLRHYSEALMSINDGVIPPFDSKISDTPILTNRVPGIPIISSLVADETVMDVLKDGTIVPKIRVYLETSVGSLPTHYYAMQYREPDGVWLTLPNMSVDTPYATIQNILDANTYEFRVAGLNNSGMSSDWSSIYSVTVNITIPLPDIISNLSCLVNIGDLQINYDLSSNIYTTGYDISINGTVVVSNYSGNRYHHTPSSGVAFVIGVRSRDIFGQVSEWVSITADIYAPNAPNVTASISGNNILVQWIHNPTSLPIATSSYYHGDTIETATLLGSGLINNSIQTPGTVGSHRFWICDTDTAGNVSVAGMVEIVITAPGQVVISPQVIDNNVLLAWTEAQGTLPIGDCELRRGATYATSIPVGIVAGRFTTLFESLAGTFTYWITQRDIAGNAGTPASITVQVSQPPDYVLHADMASAFTGGRTNTLSPTDHHSSMTVVGNVSTLNTAGAWRSARASRGVSTGKWYWEAQAVTQGINYAFIGVGTSGASLARYVGTAGGYGYYSFNGNKYLLGSCLTYGTSYNDDDTIGVALDMDGGTLEFFKNGVSQGVAVTGLTGTLYPMVSLTNAIGDSWSLNFGESAFLYPMPAGYNGLTNALLDRGALILPVDTVSTVAERMAAGGWTTRQDKINAGYPYRMEPTPAGASYEEIIDYGTTLAGTKITVTQTSQLIHGSVALGCNIKTSQDAETWTDLGDVWTAYGTAFRYAQVTITATPDGGSNDLLKLTELRVRLDVKLKNDVGMAACNASDSGGTQVNFNVSFVDIQSITLTPASGGTARFALYDFTDTANPTGFKILLYDASGNRVSGSCSWSAKGV